MKQEKSIETMVRTIRFENAEEDIGQDGARPPEFIGSPSSKALAIKNATAAMSKKRSMFDVDDDDDMWDDAVRNSISETCPDDDFIFHLSTDRNVSCSISIESVVLDKPFTEATPEVSSDQAHAVAS